MKFHSALESARAEKSHEHYGSSCFVFFSLRDPFTIWHCEGVSDDLRFLCINPRRPVFDSGLVSEIWTGMSHPKEACMDSGFQLSGIGLPS